MSERVWEYQSGFLAKGNDLVNAQTMTLEEAEEWCQGHPEAIGFSYQSAEQSPEAAVSVFIKSDVARLEQGGCSNEAREWELCPILLLWP